VSKSHAGYYFVMPQRSGESEKQEMYKAINEGHKWYATRVDDTPKEFWSIQEYIESGDVVIIANTLAEIEDTVLEEVVLVE